jgi:hypothetical protein
VKPEHVAVKEPTAVEEPGPTTTAAGAEVEWATTESPGSGSGWRASTRVARVSSRGGA